MMVSIRYFWNLGNDLTRMGQEPFTSCMFTRISRLLYLLKPTISNSRSLQIASHTECFGPNILFHLCEFFCRSPCIRRPSTVPMQIFLLEGAGNEGSNITYFTTPYAVIPSPLYPPALTASSHYITTLQPHSNPCLSLPHRPPRSQPPVCQGRLRRLGLHLVPL